MTDTPARAERLDRDKLWREHRKAHPAGVAYLDRERFEALLDEVETRLAPAPQPQEELADTRTNWQIAEQWYDEASIVESVKRQDTGAFNERQRIPPDVTSEAFGKWLTHEYRLAMNKGLQLAGRLAPAPVSANPEPGPECEQPQGLELPDSEGIWSRFYDNDPASGAPLSSHIIVRYIPFKLRFSGWVNGPADNGDVAYLPRGGWSRLTSGDAAEREIADVKRRLTEAIGLCDATASWDRIIDTAKGHEDQWAECRQQRDDARAKLNKIAHSTYGRELSRAEIVECVVYWQAEAESLRRQLAAAQHELADLSATLRRCCASSVPILDGQSEEQHAHAMGAAMERYKQADQVVSSRICDLECSEAQLNEQLAEARRALEAVQAAYQHHQGVQRRGHSTYIKETGRPGGSPWAELCDAIEALAAIAEKGATDAEA